MHVHSKLASKLFADRYAYLNLLDIFRLDKMFLALDYKSSCKVTIRSVLVALGNAPEEWMQIQ